MTVSQGAKRYRLPQLGTHAAFPGLCQLADGRLLRVWRDAPSHTGGSDGRLFGQHMDAALRTYSGPYLIADWATLDLRDPSVSVTDDGDVWLTFFSYSPGDCKVWAALSTDGGKTFATAVQIGVDAHTLAVTAPLVSTPDGALLVFCYGRQTAGQPFDGCYAYRSTDGGQTWTCAVMAADSTRHYQEPWVIRLRASGALLAAFRYGTQDHIAVNASHNGGLTWTPPTPKFPGWGRPMLLELSTGPTICIYRGPTGWPYSAILRVSGDRGGTWSGGATLDVPGAQMSYAAAVEVTEGLVAVVLGGEDSATYAHIDGLHLLDTP